jgi:hypothetical protein
MKWICTPKETEQCTVHADSEVVNGFILVSDESRGFKAWRHAHDVEA